MSHMNHHFEALQPNYLFTQVAQEVQAYLAQHPSKKERIIHMGF